MKTALHRSVTFWSGVFIMIVTGWAWWDSTRNLTSAEYGTWALKHAGCGIVVAHCSIRVGSISGPSFSVDREPIIDRSVWQKLELSSPSLFKGHLGSQVHWNERYFVRDGNVTRARNAASLHFWLLQLWFAKMTVFTAIFVPHWMILLAVALPWLVLLLRRAKRRYVATSLAA
jgi:hypothetical protein